MAGKYRIPEVFTDYREMIRRGNLDTVVLAVPDDLHFPIAVAALDAGLHVLCEKPMAFNLDQARQMLAKAEVMQRFIGFMRQVLQTLVCASSASAS